jgi:DNA-binding IclR family transcriptional regulator
MSRLDTATGRRRLNEVRRRKMSRSLGERFPEINSFSAPVFNSRGRIVRVANASDQEAIPLQTG